MIDNYYINIIKYIKLQRFPVETIDTFVTFTAIFSGFF